jgi:hypothetical protein
VEGLGRGLGLGHFGLWKREGLVGIGLAAGNIVVETAEEVLGAEAADTVVAEVDVVVAAGADSGSEPEWGELDVVFAVVGTGDAAATGVGDEV